MTQQPTRTSGRMLSARVTAGACMKPNGIRTKAAETDRPNLYKPIRVLPQEAQSLQWLTPGNVVEYTILTNFDWTIE